MSRPRRIVRVTGCVGVLLLGLCSGCVRESLADSPRLRLPAAAAKLERVERPPSFPSRWDASNWQSRESAFTRAGLVEVKLQCLSWKEAPREDPPETVWCQPLTVSGKQVVYSRGGDFGVAQDGTLHCVKLDMPSRGEKTARINGLPPSCGGGAYKETQGYSRYCVVPDGMKLGDMKALSAPQYDVSHRYSEECPPVPSSRPAEPAPRGSSD